MISKLITHVDGLGPEMFVLTPIVARMESRISTLETNRPSLSILQGATMGCPSTTAAPTTTGPTLPITSIQFPRSPSQIPPQFGGLGTATTVADSPATCGYRGLGAHSTSGFQPHQHYDNGVQDRLGVLRFSKLDFPTFDGSEDPFRWLRGPIQLAQSL